MSTLAVAYADQSRFAEAVQTAERAIELAEGTGQIRLAEQIRQRLHLFEQHQPIH